MDSSRIRPCPHEHIFRSAFQFRDAHELEEPAPPVLGQKHKLGLERETDASAQAQLQPCCANERRAMKLARRPTLKFVVDIDSSEFDQRERSTPSFDHDPHAHARVNANVRTRVRVDARGCGTRHGTFDSPVKSGL